jgi:hypothetical protein
MPAFLKRLVAVAVLLSVTVALLTLSAKTYARGEADSTKIKLGHQAEPAIFDVD